VFNDASSDSDGSVVSWNWDFGEGSLSSEQNPTHIYGSSGTYTVTLSVRDDDGVQSSEVQHTVIVTDPSSSESIAQTSLSNSQGQ
jgi:serine protease